MSAAPDDGSIARIDAARAASWPSEPANLFRQCVAPRYSTDDVPQAIASMARAFGDASGFDVSGAIVAGVVAAAAAIDDRYRLEVRRESDWFESARLWGVLLGTPSAGKSPLLRAATNPLKDLHSEMYAQWRAANEGAKEGERDSMPVLFTSDTTVDALSDVLKENARGIVVLTEEFGTWLGQIDAQRDGAGVRARGEWLQLYDGGPHQVHRVARGSVFVPNWGASVLAAGTPAGLREQMKKLPDDGLIHRFIPCLLRPARDHGVVNARGALVAWSNALRNVFTRTTCTSPGVRARISTSARSVFDAETRGLREAIDAVYDASPALASHLGKHPGMLARVALVFHVLDARQGDAIERDTMEQAARFMRTVRRHAAAMFGTILSSAPSFDLARALARSIVADAARPSSIGRYHMVQSCAAFRKADDTLRRLAVQLLEDACWLHPVGDSRPYGGWSASEWAINPRAFDLFADEGDAHRARRREVRDLILGEDD